MNGLTFYPLTKNTVTAITGALSHITNNDNIMKDVKLVNKLVHGNAGVVRATMKSKKQIQVRQNDCSTKEVICTPSNIETKLSPLTAILSAGWRIKSFKQHCLDKG